MGSHSTGPTFTIWFRSALLSEYNEYCVCYYNFPLDTPFRVSRTCPDAPPNVGRIVADPARGGVNPTYATPPDVLVYHGDSQ